jgi:hypothetical protein
MMVRQGYYSEMMLHLCNYRSQLIMAFHLLKPDDGTMQLCTTLCNILLRVGDEGSRSEIVLLQLAPQGSAVYAQGLGRLLAIPAVFCKRLEQTVPFPLLLAFQDG